MAEHTVDSIKKDDSSSKSQQPSLSLPKGGGAIRGIGEKFQVNAVTGTGSLTVPIAISPGRSGFAPQLALSYDSGSGNSPFGLGWNVGLPSVTRKTQNGLPKYQDETDSDIFLLSGAEDLVPMLVKSGDSWVKYKYKRIEEGDSEFTVYRYRPRIEGLFALIERWVNTSTGISHWKTISKGNIVSIYGENENSRIASPDDSKQIFQWFIERTFDDKGNITLFEYKKEDESGIGADILYEKNRLKNRNAFSNTYIKRIKYGNSHPFHAYNPLFKDQFDLAGWERDNIWRFELVFDYGEHAEEIPGYEEIRQWSLRQDPFSVYRSGFDIRTYRLCNRILMFHHFEDELDEPDYLVRSTDLLHHENSVASQVRSITHSSYYRDDNLVWIKKSFPPLDFTYTQAVIDENIHEVDADDLKNLPDGIGGRHQWFDLEGEGLSGLLSEHRNAWYYKRNLGKDEYDKPDFGAQELISAKPSVSNIYSGTQQLTDLGGDGQQNLVVLSNQLSGFYELEHDSGWNNFTAFRQIPNINWKDPNLRMIDLNGDGHADILITKNDCFVWYPSVGKDGYEQALTVSKVLDEEKGPALVFSDASQSVYIADMAGGGLADIVRIKNGEICYWPNLGYGRFGEKIIMANCPLFDHPDSFDHRRIRLADIDGTGTTDIFYLGNDIVTYWHNESGNGWSDKHELRDFPKTDNFSSVSVVDLLGNGTSCLVWSSVLPSNSGRHIRYIPLMSNNKPYLLSETNNNMGARTVTHYASSTKFYVEDRKAGKPWITKLPFPVHVVQKTETYDDISGSRFVSLYAYHHGYFDGVEREFRGFGMVEQWDTENYEEFKESAYFPSGTNVDEASHVPPVRTKTWFHTGFYQRGGKISKYYESEYFRNDDSAEGETGRWLLPDTVFPPSMSDDEPILLTPDDEREACRALKGRMLRQEVYADDGKEESIYPYTVTENKYHIKPIQQRGNNPYAVFYVCDCESLAFHYERNPHDPRIAHQSTLEIDKYGNPLRTVSIAYPRQNEYALHEEQRKSYITCTESDFANRDDEPDFYRVGVPWQTKTFEVTGMLADGSEPLSKKILLESIPPRGEGEINYEDQPGTGIQKRLVEQTRATFYSDDLNRELDPGEIAFHALPYKQYALAFTDRLIHRVYNTDNPTGENAATNDLPAEQQRIRNVAEIIGEQGGYVFRDGGWWHHSERQVFDERHFYMPVKVISPFGNETNLGYDGHHLALISITDPLNNVVRAENDYRVLQPRLITDPNENRTAAVFDVHGMLIATAVMGKEGETDAERMGDSVEGFLINHNLVNTDLLESILDHARESLQQSSTFFYYDLHAWMLRKAPPFALGIVRETHYRLESGTEGKVQRTVTYSDGFGREILTKVQAEDGMAPERDDERNLVFNEDGTLSFAWTDNRWIGNGRVIYNNKGKPVKQYEPYFDCIYHFNDETELVHWGVTPILHYDPLLRVIKTEMPDGTFSKVEFTPWVQTSWDANDTVLESEWYRERESLDPDGPELRSWSPEKKAAYRAAQHAGTPAIVHLDTLGRPFVSIAHNRYVLHDELGYIRETVEHFIPTHTYYDIEGNVLKITDGRGSESIPSAEAAVNYTGGNTVMQYVYALNGQLLYQNSMDAGQRWMLNNVAGKPVKLWDSRHHIFTFSYDELQRPIITHLAGGDGAAPLNHVIHRAIYGETVADAPARNLRGQPHKIYDASGLTESVSFDFKGNLLEAARQLTREFDAAAIDWSGEMPDDMLETERFIKTSEYDALNRMTRMANWHSAETDAGIYVPQYNKRGLLESETLTIGGSSADAIRAISYNEKGQRTRLHLGNNTVTRYFYDDKNFRLRQLRTTRRGYNPEFPSDAGMFKDPNVVQNLLYTYDPVGNITCIYDNAYEPAFFNNQEVEPRSEYTYDSLYRLIKATGRENSSYNAAPQRMEYPVAAQAFPVNDAHALRNYTQTYRYDAAGNIEGMRHNAGVERWTRTNEYAPDSNRLLRTFTNNAPTDIIFEYDAHGSMRNLGALGSAADEYAMTWDYKDMIRTVDLGGGGRAYYNYDSGKQRTRKHIEKNGSITEERIYLEGMERYRRWRGGEKVEEIETFHLFASDQRVLIVEDVKITDSDLPLGILYRYQYGNHLGSVGLELNETAGGISYEEYHPYGTTAYRAKGADIHATAKRYRYTGMERDEETGLNYHMARYYMPWLGRWCSSDPIGIEGGMNSFASSNGSPINFADMQGKQPEFLPGVLTDYPHLAELWDQAAEGALERRFRQGSHAANLEAYGRALELRDGRARTAYARSLFNNARRRFYRLAAQAYSQGNKVFGGLPLTESEIANMRRGNAPRRGIQIHHGAPNSLAANPGSALESTRLGMRTGNEGTPGGSHHAQHTSETAVQDRMRRAEVPPDIDSSSSANDDSNGGRRSRVDSESTSSPRRRSRRVSSITGAAVAVLSLVIDLPEEFDFIVTNPVDVIILGVTTLFSATSAETRCIEGETAGGSLPCTPEMRRELRDQRMRQESIERFANEHSISFEEAEERIEAIQRESANAPYEPPTIRALP